jgi:hypothetical protein
VPKQFALGWKVDWSVDGAFDVLPRVLAVLDEKLRANAACKRVEGRDRAAGEAAEK